MARSGGFEPPTAWFVARYSIQLSYERVALRDANYRDTRCLSQYAGNRTAVFFMPLLYRINPSQQARLSHTIRAMSELIALLLLIAGIWYWQDTAIAREIALRQCRRSCRELGLQLLDQTVERTRSHLIRINGGPRVLRREYRFEFTTTGEQRYVGFICIVRRQVQDLHLDLPGEATDGHAAPHQLFLQPEQQEH